MLVTNAELGTYLGISLTGLDATVLARITNALVLGQGTFEQFVGYRVEGSEIVYFDGDGGAVLWLPHFPVISVTNLQYYDSTLSAWASISTEYIRTNVKTGELSLSSSYSANLGGLTQSVFPVGFQNVRCTETFGYTDVNGLTDPRYATLQAIKMAISEIASLIFKHAGDLSFNSIDDGVQKTRYDFSGATFMYMISPEVVGIIHSLAKRGVSR